VSPSASFNADAMFQSAPPYGGERPRRSLKCPPTFCFNPRPRTGANLEDLPTGHRPWVSIRAPVRGRTVAPLASRCVAESFNPRPRTGANGHGHVQPDQRPVSIRAPVRGRTTSENAGFEASRFQSAPPYGGELARIRGEKSLKRFQSAPPYGGEPGSPTDELRIDRVSIRAPVRGRTNS